MLGQDETDGRVGQRIHGVHVLFPGNAEDALHPFILQTSDKDPGGSHGTSLERVRMVLE